MSATKKLKELNIVLPIAADPVGAYVAYKIVNNLLYISGQLPINADGKMIKGKLGKDLSTEEGYEAAKRCGLAILSQVKKACNNNLSKIKSCLKLTGYVNSTENYTDQPKVINGASEIISKILEINGLHVRAAVSVNSLPLGVAVEIDAIFELN